MADDLPEKTPEADKENLDLSSLSSFSLGPDWVSGKKPRTRLPQEAFDDRPKGPRGPRKDRRGPMANKTRPRSDGERQGGRPQRHDRRERSAPAELFQPVIAVDFYPEEEPFKVLSQAIKTSCRTFELFEIARLILEKPDRWVCVARDPSHKEGEPAKLWASVPDGLPFQSEEEALAHTYRHYLSEFFEMETVEVDPPAGSFQMVHKCGLSGELLAPPNYHRYQAICREHHAAKLSHLPYAKFEQRIESSREEEDIQAWVEKMKTQTRYIFKENPEQTFDSKEDARLYLVTQAKDKLVRPAYSARFSGKALALLNPGSPIRRSVEYLLEGQKRFPLDTANHLRGRLRRMHFAVYKRGSKGVSFVCAVKRHFRKPDEVLSDNLQALIDFLEKRPNFPAKDLPRAYLASPGQVEGKAQPDVAPAADDSTPEETGEAPAEKPTGEDVSTAAPADKKPAAELTPEETEAIKKLKTDLHYLVSQGYVIEYSDGRLFVPPIREDEIRHLEKQKAIAEMKEADGTKDAPVEKEAENKTTEEVIVSPEEPAEETPASEAPVSPEPASEDASAGEKPATLPEDDTAPEQSAAAEEPPEDSNKPEA